MMRIGNVFSNQQSLDQFVSDTVQWPKNDWKSFVSHWKFRDVCKILPKHRNQLDTVLSSAISPSKHSIAYSYILGFKANEKGWLDDAQSLNMFLSQVKQLLDEGSMDQIAMCPRPFTDAFRYFIDYIKASNGLKTVVPLLKQAIRLLQGGNEHVLTFAHCELVFCCVESYCYHLAFPQINADIIEINGDGSLRPLDNLRYHYYTALIFIGLKKYAKALDSLTMVLTAPSECISCLQIEAYKKFILVSLVHKQKLIPLPRYTPGNLKRFYRKFCGAYLEISDSFTRGYDAVLKVVEKNTELYTKDHNFGLVRQVLNTATKNAVRKLTSVYTRLSIDKVASLCDFESPDAAKKLLVSMIRNNELSATIDANNVVKFEESVTESDAEMLAKIHHRIKSLLDLWSALDNTQLEVKKSPKFIKKALNLGGPMGEDMAQQMLLDSMINGPTFFRS